MKNLHYLFSVLMAFQAQAQTLLHKGVVQTAENKPVEYANVILSSLPDSVFMAGTVTDSLGRFSLEASNAGGKTLLTISCLGYETFQAETSGSLPHPIHLRPAVENLDEVVVEARRKEYRMKGTTLHADIQTGLLKDAGSALDVLKHVPFVHIDSKAITVFGKGEPLIYINHKKIRDREELQRLNSAQIKNVEVLTSPGAQYDASVGAVIRITTLRPLSQGLGGSLYGRVEKREKWSEAANLNLSYKLTRWELYADFAAMDARRKQDQEDLTFIEDEVNYQTGNTAALGINRRQYAAATGADYIFGEHHSAGARYNYAWLGKSDYAVTNRLEHFRQELVQQKLENAGLYSPDGHDHYLNTYYAGDIEAFHLNGNADYAQGYSSTAASYLNRFADGHTETIGSSSKNTYTFAAAKFDATRPVGKGTGLAGAEYAYTDNKSHYGNDSWPLQEDLPDTQTANRQHLWALYLNYQWASGCFSLDAGLRFEQINFVYKLNGELQKDQSKKYTHLFPVLTLSFDRPERSFHTSLSYKRTIRRPSYYQLRGDIQYNSPYAYEAGNPALLSAFVNDVSYSLAYRDLTFLTSYQFVKDKIFFITEQFNAKPVTLSRFINIDRYKRLNASVVWSPTLFHIWTPEIEAGVEKQFLSFTYAGRKSAYNHPLLYVSLYNTLRLPWGIQLVLSGAYSTAYHSDFIYTHPNKWVDFSIQKKCLKDKLTLRLGAEDVFDTNTENWRMDYQNVRYGKWNSADNRAVYFSLSYNFSTLKEYKGQGAATKERRRLNTL